LRVLAQIPDVQPIAVPLRKSRSAELVSQGFVAVGSIAEARAEGATACIIATDTNRHVSDAIEAMKSGMDILVEKPLATDAAEARRLQDAVPALGRRGFVGCVLRFSESLNSFRSLLPLIGAVHSVRVECQSYLPEWRPDRPYKESYSARASEGGVLRDLIHEIDYTCWMFGWPEHVQADLDDGFRLGISSEAQAHLTWRTPAGAHVSVCLDYLTRPARRRVYAFGETGTLEWDGVQQRITRHPFSGQPEVHTSTQDRDAMLQAQDGAFIRSGITADERLATLEDGVRALAICDAARIAAAVARREVVRYS